MAKLSKDTRKHRRVKSFFLLKYQTGAATGKEQLTNLHDISEGGLRFQTNQRLPENSIINLAVLIPSFEKPIEVEAKVVWVGQSKKKDNAYSVAVQFVKVSGDTQGKLNEFFKGMVKENKNPMFIDLPQFGLKKK